MKTKVLILGGSGMLGHQVFKTLKVSDKFDVKVTIRRNYSLYFKESDFFLLKDISNIEVILDNFNPQYIINCIGAIKQKNKNVLEQIQINSLFPIELNNICLERGIRLIHISTDCVFSGQKGNYVEEDITDAEDAYGKTKALSDVGLMSTINNTLILRTSIIGPELYNSSYGLFEWAMKTFKSNNPEIKGYTKAIFSGLTTYELSRVIKNIIENYPNIITGLYHVSSEPITKYRLLTLIKNEFDFKFTDVKPSNDVICDKSLNSDKFKKDFNYTPPTWEEMIKELRYGTSDRK